MKKKIKLMLNLFMSLLQTTLIVLKLAGVLNVSWIIILSPILLPLTLGIIFLLVAVIFYKIDEYEPNI